MKKRKEEFARTKEELETIWKAEERAGRYR